MALHADTLAEETCALERSKKISWFATVGKNQTSESELNNLVNIRDGDRLQAEILRANEDAGRRVSVAHQHMAPLDEKLRNAAVKNSNSSSTAADNQQPTEDDVNNVLLVYPAPPKSSFDPLHPESSAFRWTPAASDFFPNTKTMIESRKGALQQFKQLCYFALLRKRVESRLETLQRERGFQLQQQQQQQQQDSAGTTTANNNRTSSSKPPLTRRTVSPNIKQQQQKKTNNTFVILSDVYDPLPNPTANAPFALTRELKTQVEKKLLEEALNQEGNANSSGNNNGRSTPTVDNNTTSSSKGRKDTSNSKKSSSATRSHSSDKKKGNDASSKHGKHGSHTVDFDGNNNKSSSPDAENNNNNQHRGGAASNRVATFSVSSNLQLLQPLRISDMEVHPEIKPREPFAFKTQRLPRLPFPKHDFSVAGPKNAPLNFPAGTSEVSENPISNPAKVVVDALIEQGEAPVFAKNYNKADMLAASQNNSGGLGKSGRGQHRSSSAGQSNNNKVTFSASSNNNNAKTTAKQKSARSISGHSSGLTARNVATSFILPQVSVETFELPSIIASNNFRPPMQLQNGATALSSGVRDFVSGQYTKVASAPLEAARPSPVSPRHRRLNVAAMKNFFAVLPKTLTKVDPLDDLSDDEDHDLVGLGSPSDEGEAKKNGDTNAFVPESVTKKLLNQQEDGGLAGGGASAATFLATPPLSLDSALNLLRVPPSKTQEELAAENQRIQKVISGGAATAATMASSKKDGRPLSPTKRPATPTQKVNNQKNSSSSDAAEEGSKNGAGSGSNKNKKQNAQDRMEWKSQPVHSEDIHQVNARVEEVLKKSTESSEKRKGMIPGFLQHLA